MSKTVAIAIVLVAIASNSSSASPIPAGFKLVFSESGVEFYQRNSQPSVSEYVAIADLNRSSIANIIGKVDGAPDGKLERKYLQDFWDDAVKQNGENRKVKVLFNGTFFSQKLDPSPIAFGLKVEGNVASYGYGLDEFPGLIKIFGFDSATAFISDYQNRESFKIRTPNLVGALDSKANKSAQKRLPRTFVGVKDANGDNINDTVIFYSSNSAKQADAVRVLKSFGAIEKVMLDGGSSTGLIVNGRTYINPSRTIPHAIALYAGK